MRITLADPGAPLALYVNESYTLDIPADGPPIAITAPTNVGALHALQTLSRAVSFDFEAQQYVVAGAAARGHPRRAIVRLARPAAGHGPPLGIP